MNKDLQYEFHQRGDTNPGSLERPDTPTTDHLYLAGDGAALPHLGGILLNTLDVESLHVEPLSMLMASGQISCANTCGLSCEGSCGVICSRGFNCLQ